jgi:2-methylcitrate dehydratase
MTVAEEMAAFVERAAFDDLTPEAQSELKLRVLDSLGCAIGALSGEPIRALRRQATEFAPDGPATLIGGGRTSPDLAAFHNAALVRYLDFNDSYLAPRETCHPSDNLGAVLAAAEYAGAGGKELLAALAVAYQVQCRLSEEAPVRAKGFDHTTQGAYAAAAGAAKALGLDRGRTAHAIAMSGTALNALRVTRTGALSHWKGLAYPWTAFGATHLAFLAMRGITGPPAVVEGNKGFIEAIAGPFRIDWAAEDLERVRWTIIKKYNAEIHSQSVLEGVLELEARHGFRAGDVEKVEVEIFDVAYHIIGGGEEGDKQEVRTKEEADHSLHYLVAVALLDGGVMPEQYAPERILRADVQELLRKVRVRPHPELTSRFPRELPCRIAVRLAGGRVHEIEKRDYHGFTTRPMGWDEVAGKFRRLCAGIAGERLQEEIIEVVASLEAHPVSRLTEILARVHRGES